MTWKYYNQKKRVRKHTAHWLPSTNLGTHVLLIYSTELRPSISHSILIAYWHLQTNITRSKTYKCLAFHTTTEHVLQHPSPASPIHIDASQGNSFITLQTMYISRKHKLAFPSNVHKNTRFPVPSSLFRSNSSALARLITRRSGKF
jgi:hypothetical protein